MPDLEIGPDDPHRADVQSLLAEHLSFARANSPPEDVHALDTPGLLADGVTFYCARQRVTGTLLAIGALRQLADGSAEVKSMHTAAHARGRGVGRAMLDGLLATARARGCPAVYLETGTAAAFAPARGLYASAGFTACQPFGAYRAGPHSVCLVKDLLSGT